MTTLHVLTDPSTPVTPKIRSNPFSWLSYKFITYITRYGWNCIHYGIPGSEAPCETVSCLDYIDKTHQKNMVKYNEVAGKEIQKRKNSEDIILCFYGTCNKYAAVSNPDLKVVEPSIGYTTDAVWAPYRVFPSSAHMHYYYGTRNMLMTSCWFDDVIYNPITISDFEYKEEKQDYFVCFGRVTEYKGIRIAIEATQKTNTKLIIAGSGDYDVSNLPSHVEYIGECDVEKRKTVLANAKAIIAPTFYLEPFGNMVVEAAMSGTPAITTDWGAFRETVIQGVTGFRCRELKDFTQAIENISSIKSNNCREFAVTNFEDGVIYPQFNKYLQKIKQSNWYRD